MMNFLSFGLWASNVFDKISTLFNFQWSLLFCVDPWATFIGFINIFVMGSKPSLNHSVINNLSFLLRDNLSRIERRDNSNYICDSLLQYLYEDYVFVISFHFVSAFVHLKLNVREISQYTSRGKIQIIECSSERINLVMLSCAGKTYGR